MQFLWKWIDELAGKGLSVTVISELLLYVSASLVPMALPLAILLASIMTFGNMGENSELIALKSSGISLQRIMSPLIIFMAFMSILAFFFSNNVMPFANLKMQSLLYDVSQKRPEFQLREGIFYNGIENYSIKIGHKENKTNLLREVMIYDHSENRGNVNVTVADSGYMKMTADSNLIFILLDGYSYTEMPKSRVPIWSKQSYPDRRDHFEQQEIILPMKGFEFNRSDENLFKGGYKMMNLNQLKRTTDSLNHELNTSKKQFYKLVMVGNYFRNDRVYKIETRTNSDTVIGAHFKEMDLDSAYSTFPLEEKRSVMQQALNLARAAKSHISGQVEDFSNREKRIRKHQIEWHRKFTLSFACLIFFFIGAPLGAIIRRGGLGMPVVVSVLFFVFYYVISLMGEKFARESVLPVIEGMWISSFILLPLGVFLTFKATTDSTILTVDTYSEIYKKIITFLRLKAFLKIDENSPTHT